MSNESVNQAEFAATIPVVPANNLVGELILHVSNTSWNITLNVDSGNGSRNTKRLNIFLIDGD
ncbi:dihydrolipoamide dehydrogenase [Rickettsia canadensis str. McKiel]|uniref:Dihydrolipoamide dehydrogenase n=1 Tax=Rickettsia canadensis (strain McKiel) TaxID=293613 RepID=A8F029_RICCK|nr:hypothetical protein [Rickettsia canadensis]ABV73962.1 dihydrolipoamide dehydrogenase [Rickettsia canadensis str. McKiel]